MKILKEIAIIFTLCLIGEVISISLPFPIPAAIISMILLAILLFTGLLKLESINEFGSFLLSNMAFFFVPAGVRVLEHFTLIGEIWLPFLLISLLATFFTFLTTAAAVSLMLKIQNKRGER